MSKSRKYWIGQMITGFVLAGIFGILLAVHEINTGYIAATIVCGGIGIMGLIILLTKKT